MIARKLPHIPCGRYGPIINHRCSGDSGGLLFGVAVVALVGITHDVISG